MPHPSDAASVPLSVIIPTRDTRALTLRCLETLGASVSPPAEVLVVDDGSRDGTADAVRADFPHVRILRREDPGGFTAAVNDAWPLATSEIVLLLNSDTEVSPQATRGFAAAFARDPRLGIAGASLHYPDGRPQWSAGPEPDLLWLLAVSSGGVAALARLPAWRRVRPESNVRGDAAWLPATAMAIRQEVRGTIGLFDPIFTTYAQDLDYCTRARAAGWRVAQLPDVHVRHLLGATIAIGGRAVASRQDPEALLSDLARWIHKSHPPAQARRRCRALDAGTRARLAARFVRRWFLSSADRATWDRDSDRYRAALAALTRE